MESRVLLERGHKEGPSVEGPLEPRPEREGGQHTKVPGKSVQAVRIAGLEMRVRWP